MLLIYSRRCGHHYAQTNTNNMNKDEPNTVLCGNSRGYHNTQLTTQRQIMVQIVQNELHFLKPGTNSRDTDNIGNKQAQRQTQHRNLKR